MLIVEATGHGPRHINVHYVAAAAPPLSLLHATRPSSPLLQALEPSTLIALQLLAPGGRLVLVGDPQQLPATVVSRAAAAAALAQSLFERLMQASSGVSVEGGTLCTGAGIPQRLPLTMVVSLALAARWHSRGGARGSCRQWLGGGQGSQL